MDSDEKRFCSKCNWNDCDYGCTCPPNEVFNTIWEQEKVNAIVISKGATNGDMIKLLFQNFLFIPCEKHNLLQMLLYEDNENQKGLITLIEFNLDWWNSSYKEGEKNDKTRSNQ